MHEPRPLTAAGSALRWALVAFLFAAVLGGFAFASCTRHSCLAQTPGWTGWLAAAYMKLAMPWLFVAGAMGASPLLELRPAALPFALGSAASVALITFMARYGVVGLGAILRESPPADPARRSDQPWTPVAIPLIAVALFLVGTLAEEGWSLHNLRVAIGSNALAFALAAGLCVLLAALRSLESTTAGMVLSFLWITFRRVVSGLLFLVALLFAAMMCRTGEVAGGLAVLAFGSVFASLGWFGDWFRRWEDY